MRLWHWVRAQRGWVQLIVFLLGLPTSLAALYVAVRSLQYLAAEGDAGLYAPASVQAVVRVRGLEGQLDRLQDSFAWRALEKKVLGDPAIRRPLNAALKEAGLPTIDDLMDPRKSGVYSKDNLLRAAGRDLVAGLAAPDSWKTARFCVATRLRWADYLLTPFAGLVLKREGETLKAGRRLWVAFAGAMAVAGNDKALVEEALRGRGRAPEGKRPVEFSLRFDGSRPLQALREEFRQLGALPHVKLETARAVRGWADLDGTVLRGDAVLEGVEASFPGRTPPWELATKAPSTSSGAFASTASFRELYALLKASRTPLLQQMVEQLERGKLSETLLPLIEPGIAVITGVDEHKGRLYPAFALLVRSSDPKQAADAVSALVKKISGNFGEGKTKSELLGESEVFWVDLPDGAGVEGFMAPTWGATGDGLVFGNNVVFVKSLLGPAGDLWSERRIGKRLKQRLKELGFAAEPGLAGGVLVPPLLRESLDGVLRWFAGVAAVPSETAFRAELEREWADQGKGGLPEGGPGEGGKFDLYAEARRARVEAFGEDLRLRLRVLDAVRWMAFESGPVPDGASLKFAVGFDTLN